MGWGTGLPCDTSCSSDRHAGAAGSSAGSTSSTSRLNTWPWSGWSSFTVCTPSVSATEKVLARPSVRSTNFLGRAEAWNDVMSAWFPVATRTSSTTTIAGKADGHRIGLRVPARGAPGGLEISVHQLQGLEVGWVARVFVPVGGLHVAESGHGREDDSEERAEGHVGSGPDEHRARGAVHSSVASAGVARVLGAVS